MVQANQQAKDGFRDWFQMCTPTIFGIGAHTWTVPQIQPENILQFEQLVMQYEQTSKETYPSDLNTATLIPPMSELPKFFQRANPQAAGTT